MKKGIPLRGFCKTNDSKIIEYLIENLYVPPYPRHDTTNIVGIAWNKMNWWYVYTNSSKPNVSESYIKNLMKESDNSELDEKEMEQMSEIRTKINKKSKTDLEVIDNSFEQVQEVSNMRIKCKYTLLNNLNNINYNTDKVKCQQNLKKVLKFF